MPNLGIKQKDAYGDMPVCGIDNKDKNETVYPNFCLRDKFLEASGLDTNLKIGDKITVTLELEVCGVNAHKGRSHTTESVDFDVISLEKSGDTKSSDEDEQKKKETEMLGYERISKRK